MKTPLGRWRNLGLVAAVLIVVGAWPVRYLASPRWEVWVVNDKGHPIPQVNVRLVYQNYSAEGQSHEVTLETDSNGMKGRSNKPFFLYLESSCHIGCSKLK